MDAVKFWTRINEQWEQVELVPGQVKRYAVDVPQFPGQHVGYVEYSLNKGGNMVRSYSRISYRGEKPDEYVWVCKVRDLACIRSCGRMLPRWREVA